MNDWVVGDKRISTIRLAVLTKYRIITEETWFLKFLSFFTVIHTSDQTFQQHYAACRLCFSRDWNYYYFIRSFTGFVTFL